MNNLLKPLLVVGAYTLFYPAALGKGFFDDIYLAVNWLQIIVIAIGLFGLPYAIRAIYRCFKLN
ncbi:MAG: hypothetical protein AAF413_02985 [Patescibacteria group bacterium]